MNVFTKFIQKINAKRANNFFPSRIAIAVNGVCNLKCKMCDIGQNNIDAKFYKTMKSNEEISLDTLRKIADELTNKQTSIHFNGTEPLLYKNIIEAITLFTSQNIKCNLTTNGFFLPSMSKDILKTNLNELFVSIDGPREIHDAIRGVPGTYNRCIEGITQILNSRKKRLMVTVAIAISDLNAPYLAETVDNIMNLGVNRIIISHLNFVTEDMAIAHNKHFENVFGNVNFSSMSAVNPFKVDVTKLNDDIISIRKKYGDNVLFSPDIHDLELETYYNYPEKFVFSDTCEIAWSNMQVLPNGNVIPASRCFNKSMGNVNTMSVAEIWSGDGFNTFREKIKDCKATPACTRCCALFNRRTLS